MRDGEMTDEQYVQLRRYVFGLPKARPTERQLVGTILSYLRKYFPELEHAPRSP